MKNKKFKIIFFLFSELFVVALLSFFIVKNLKAKESVEITFFDVGQGDSAMIDLGNNFQILIDGGPDSSVLDKLGENVPYYDNTIEMVILTHPDFDHLMGLIDVLNKYEVKYVFATSIFCDSEMCQEWKNLIQEKGIILVDTFYGRKIDFDEDTYIEFIYPFSSLNEQKVSKYNYSSIAFKFTNGKNTFLFAGDIEFPNELDLYNYDFNLKSDVLKVAHHGSKTSSSILFVEKVRPEIAVISVGENQWGMPNELPLANLSSVGANLLTTREKGDIQIVSDGETFFLKK